MTNTISQHEAAADENPGARILRLADSLAQHSETPDGLSCTFLTPAHRATAAALRDLMQAAGLAAEIDAAANVVGRYASDAPEARTLIIGSHYDTVRNAGKYDGRLGILTGLVVLERLALESRRLPFHIELIAFSEEEGVRFAKPFIGSSAIAGRFEPAALATRDAAGVTLAEALQAAGHDPATIGRLARKPAALLGYLEVHIEQGPVLLEENLPVGVVTAINGAVRELLTVTGTAGHAGTVPMRLRHDAAAAAAEMLLVVERICGTREGVVGTVGQLAVPGGAVNVIPGRAQFSLDLRAGDDTLRDAALAEVHAEFQAIATRRGVRLQRQETMRMPAVPCAPRLQAALGDAITRTGNRPFALPSGAGHDAMMFAGVTDIGMLFVRCGNGGISHDPAETVTAADTAVAAEGLYQTLLKLAGTI